MKIQIASMLKSTLALTLIAASATAANAAPFGNLIHLHPHVTDSRVQVSLRNDGNQFKEVTVDGTTYEILPHETAVIKANAGTFVYAGFNVASHKKGAVLVQITDKMNGSKINLI
jgi:hypothetical protein